MCVYIYIYISLEKINIFNKVLSYDLLGHDWATELNLIK